MSKSPQSIANGLIEDWAEEILQGATSTPGVAGGGFIESIYIGGPAGKITARGGASKPYQQSKAPTGVAMRVLSPTSLKVDQIMRDLHKDLPECALVIRVEHGLQPEIDRKLPAVEKGKLIGPFVGGRTWSESTYLNRAKRGYEWVQSGLRALRIL